MKDPYIKKTLPNGVRLILVPMASVNSIATAVAVGVGSRYETAKINGISHFLEHMVFKGTKKYPTTDDVNSIERAGGLQNAYTDIDVTNYHNKVLHTDWELALEINKELAIEPKLPKEWVDMERGVIIEEMKRYDDEPASKVEEAYHALLYPNSRLGMRIIGEKESLHAVTDKELREYHDAWYVPERIVVLLAGNVAPYTSVIEERLNEWFGHLKKKKTESVELVTPKQSKPALTVITKNDAAQAHMIIGLRSFARASEDRFAWNLFNLIMGVSFTSRLFKEVREKRGLCYHIRSTSSTYQEVGSWDIYAGVATEKVEEATKAIIEELHKANGYGITADELIVAKKRLKTMLAFRSEDPEFWTEWYSRAELYDMPLMSMEDYIKKIEKISVETINDLVKKYFKTQNLNMALVWSKKQDDSLKELLKI
jgi:predicted Zn-dependent peptidase